MKMNGISAGAAADVYLCVYVCVCLCVAAQWPRLLSIRRTTFCHFPPSQSQEAEQLLFLSNIQCSSSIYTFVLENTYVH